MITMGQKPSEITMYPPYLFDLFLGNFPITPKLTKIINAKDGYYISSKPISKIHNISEFMENPYSRNLSNHILTKEQIGSIIEDEKNSVEDIIRKLFGHYRVRKIDEGVKWKKLEGHDAEFSDVGDGVYAVCKLKCKEGDYAILSIYMNGCNQHLLTLHNFVVVKKDDKGNLIQLLKENFESNLRGGKSPSSTN